ncbi:MAG: T9SS type A sorting domain-containing protein [candidate division WOR-3 bacterium]
MRVLGGGAYALAYNPKNNKIYRARSHGEPGFLDILDGVSDSIIKTIPTPNVAPFSLLYNSNTNTIFCVGARSTQDEVMVVDGSSDRILENFTIPAQNWGYGYIGGVAAPPRYALVFDSLNNLVYLNHYCSSKISVINGNVGVQEYTPKLPGRVVLRVYPNPAAQHATIELSLPNTREVKMAIYDVTGKIVKSINLPNIRFCRLNWQGNDYSGKKLPCGVYFLRLKAGDYSETKKLVMISK